MSYHRKISDPVNNTVLSQKQSQLKTETSEMTSSQMEEAVTRIPCSSQSELYLRVCESKQSYRKKYQARKSSQCGAA